MKNKIYEVVFKNKDVLKTIKFKDKSKAKICYNNTKHRFDGEVSYKEYFV